MPLISKQMLFDAKAYVCWDVFSHLSVQLIPLDQPVAYYYPPQNPNHNIVVFYFASASEFAEPLFLLFHECGHVKQWKALQKGRNTSQFYASLNAADYNEKQQFEIQAWQHAEQLLADFLLQQYLEQPAIMQRFKSYRDECLRSYAGR